MDPCTSHPSDGCDNSRRWKGQKVNVQEGGTHSSEKGDTQIYFDLDLRLPRRQSLRRSILKKRASQAIREAKMGDKMDKSEDTPELPEVDPGALTKTEQPRTSLRVTFKQTETMEEAQLPYCRRKQYRSSYQGALHAATCKNQRFENPEVLGYHRWVNRLAVVQWLEDRVKSQLHTETTNKPCSSELETVLETASG